MKRQYKWIFTIGAIVLFLFAGGMLPGEPLSNRAMVVGFGIDFGKDEKFSVSAQILNPGAGDTGINSRVVTAEHSTVAGAMTYISEKSGLSVALTHCNVIMIGEDVAKSPQLYSVLNYLLTNNYLSENAYLFATEGSAKEILNSKTGFGGNASFYMQKLVGMYGDYNDINQKTLQDFIVDYHQLGQANWLPVIKMEETEKEISSDAQSGDSKEKEYLFNLNSIYVFQKNIFIAEYGADGTSALNYVKKKVSKGNINAVGDNGEKIVFYILDKKNKIDYNLNDKKVTMKMEITAILKEIIDLSQSDKFVDRNMLTDTEITNAANFIKANIEKFYAEMQDYNLDIFGFHEGFYAKYGKASESLSLSDISLELSVKIKI